MIIRVRDGGIGLDDIDTLTSFKVAALESFRARLDQAVAPVGWFDGEHVWISEAWLRQATLGRPADWVTGFEKMLAFARAKGWFDETSGAIRAHVDWEP